tara:strand:- start:143 stop:853 length:711 start_codon:yes stop_codon:yes gene_type:complete
MKSDTTEGCDRCSDYDKVKDELEGNKRKSQDEQKNALKKCETSKTKLQKKLLTVGAAAVVAGTILGKDFVDKVAQYIESFNSVKNSASKLIGKADVSTQQKPVKNDDEAEEYIDEYFTLVFPPRVIDTTEWPAVMTTSTSKQLDIIMNGFDGMSIVNTIIDSQMYNDYDFIEEDIYHLPYLIRDLTLFGIPMEGEYILPENRNLSSTAPSYYVASVPEAGTLGFLAIPLTFHSRRR